jgi:hypothetical protein
MIRVQADQAAGIFHDLTRTAENLLLEGTSHELDP